MPNCTTIALPYTWQMVVGMLSVDCCNSEDDHRQNESRSVDPNAIYASWVVIDES